jgi:hypothetical protein
MIEPAKRCTVQKYLYGISGKDDVLYEEIGEFTFWGRHLTKLRQKVAFNLIGLRRSFVSFSTFFFEKNVNCKRALEVIMPAYRT